MASTRFTINGESWTYDQSKLGFKEVEMLEKATGVPFGAIEQKANEGSIFAIGALVWLAQRRAGLKVKWSDFDFDIQELTVEELDDDGNVIVDEPDTDEQNDEGDTGPLDGTGDTAEPTS